jgi:hypothetical protein
MSNRVLDILPHHLPKKYPNQKILIVTLKYYAHCVPFVMDKEHYFK